MSIQKLELIVKKLRQEESRWDAILELKLLDVESVLDPLLYLLKDKDWVIRWCIAEKLGDVRDVKVVQPLLQALVDKDPHVQKNAAKSLEKMGDLILPYAIPYLEHPKHFARQHIMELIMAQGQKSVPYLLRHLKSNNWVLSNIVLYLLFKLKPDNLEVILTECFQIDTVQKNAVMMAGILNYVNSLGYLIKAYKIPKLRHAIIHTLQEFDKDVVYPRLVDALKNPLVQETAKHMILKLKEPMLVHLLKKLPACDATSRQALILIEKIGIESVLPQLVDMSEKNTKLAQLTRNLLRRHPLKNPSTKQKKWLGGLLK